jgi:ATP-dependent DNA helicase RecG
MVLSTSDVQAMLAQGMGARLHWFPSDVQPSRLAAVLAGMANAQGGTVLLGVAPRSAHIQGVVNVPDAVDCVFQAALLIDPPLVLPVPQVINTSRGRLLWIMVPGGLPHVYSLEGRYLGREGTQTNPLPARGLRHLLMERGVIQLESQVPPSATLDDLDRQKVTSYVRQLDLPGEEPVEAILLRRGCLRLVGERSAQKHSSGATARTGDTGLQESKLEFDLSALRPTYAALLLFGKYPQQWLPNASILAARFSGRTLSDHFFKQEFAGTLPEQLRLAEAFLRDNMRNVVRLVGLAHQEMSEYPLEALRELLVNAVAHRDYNLQGDNTHIHIFADRIEVHSPGLLPGPMNLGNLLEARFSRNPVIMQVLSDMGFVERLGYGLNRVMEAMRQNALQPPRFEETAGTFRVTLFGASEARMAAPPPDLRAYRAMDLNSRQGQALAFLLKQPAVSRRITSRDYQELCPDVHAETLRRDLVDLVERGLLIKVGDKRATYYILKKSR